jgi:acetylornithine/succinyldiaminopimelate/putrescine aminotransferase
MKDLLKNDKATKQEVVESAADHVCPNRVDTFKMLGEVPIMGKRQGNYFWDRNGRKYFDVHINGGTYNLGHRNPELIDVLKEALDHYDMGNHHFVSVARTALAEELIKSVPGSMKYCVFTTSGSEAVEVTLRSARKATERRKIVSFKGSYHGHGGLSLRAGYAEQAIYFLSDQPQEEFVQVPFDDLDAMEEVLKGDDIAAVLCEMIPATVGFLMPSAGYYVGLKKLCEKYGALFIADEVQTGLGRTGKMWACETFGIKPDMLVSGKGLTGGIYPIGVAVMSEESGNWLKEDGWGFSSTSGGSELGCIVALKVLEIVSRAGLLENVNKMSELLSQGLKEIKSQHPFLTAIRETGLIFGLCFDHADGGALMTICGLETGLWAFPAGFDRSVLQFKPNLLVNEEDCKELLQLVEKTIVLCEEKFELN